MGQVLDAAAKMPVGADIGGEKAMRGTLTFMLQSVESPRVHEQRRYLYRLWTRDLDTPVKLP
jgi:3-hydroxyacyl-[acyl-carrier-protein] dehydratase